MKTTNMDLLRSVKALKVLADRNDIPFMAAFAIARNIISIDTALADYMKEKTRLDGTYLTTEGTPTVKAGMEEDYLRELTELNSTKIDIVLQKIDPKALSGIQLAPSLLIPVMFMFETDTQIQKGS